MRSGSKRRQIDAWAGTTGRWVGIVVILAGLVLTFKTGAPQTDLIGLGVILWAGGLGVEEILNRIPSRRHESEREPKEEKVRVGHKNGKGGPP